MESSSSSLPTMLSTNTNHQHQPQAVSIILLVFIYSMEEDDIDWLVLVEDNEMLVVGVGGVDCWPSGVEAS